LGGNDPLLTQTVTSEVNPRSGTEIAKRISRGDEARYLQQLPLSVALIGSTIRVTSTGVRPAGFSSGDFDFRRAPLESSS
jgi:hypothetical protein